MKNLITVYITNRNYGKYLKKSIESVLNQSYKNIFIIIIDDASTDNSKKILKRYKEIKNIKIIFNRRKLGLIRSSNLAIKNSKGDFILRLDADDYLSTNAISIMLKSLIKRKNFKMIFPDFFYVNSSCKIISKYKYKHKSRYNLSDSPAHGACSLIDLKFLKKIGGYNNKFDCQDGHYIWYKIISEKKYICHLNKSAFFYRKHKKNLSKNKKKILSTRLEIINFFLKRKKNYNQFEKLKTLTEKEIKNL